MFSLFYLKTFLSHASTFIRCILLHTSLAKQDAKTVGKYLKTQYLMTFSTTLLLKNNRYINSKT